MRSWRGTQYAEDAFLTADYLGKAAADIQDCLKRLYSVRVPSGQVSNSVLGHAETGPALHLPSCDKSVTRRST